MALGILAIAKGAANIAGKIVEGVKNRREKAINKAAANLVEKQARLDQATNFFTPGIASEPRQRKPLFSSLKTLINPEAGSQAISGAGNNIAAIKGGDVVPSAGREVYAQPSGPGMNPMFLIAGAGLLIFLLFKKR
jgi:hypothetical protein